MREPVDQQARDEAVQDLDTSFFLEAGAGTGKTRVLVDRVVEIVRRGAADMDQVVVITFGEKAAGELRGRIREAFHRETAAGSGPKRDQFLAALQSLDAAHIETIHAFASSILRERPLEARLDPNFQQLDEVGNELDFKKRWNNWIWGVGGDALGAVERCLLLGLPLSTVRQVARHLARHRDVTAVRTPPAPPNAEDTFRTLRTTCESLSTSAELCHNESDTCFKAFQEFVTGLDGLSELNGEALERDLNLLSLRPKKGALRNWATPDARDQLYVGLEQLAAQLKEYQEVLRQEALASLVVALAGFVSQSAKERLREGNLNFEDLLIEARRVLQENAQVRRYFQDRYRYILVDEFQDTDPLQAEIVFLLAADEPQGSTGAIPDWTQVTIAPGKLFLVGDPQQSIYRFRRADIGSFTKARDMFARHESESHAAKVRTIAQSFRAVPEVTRWVNELFRGVIQVNHDFPSAQPEYVPIEPYRPDAGQPRVIHLYPKEDLGTAKTREVRRFEAQAVASLIAEMVKGDRWHLTDRGDDGSEVESERPITFRDVSILVETRTEIDIYTDALTARSIPFILDGGREFFQRQEVREIVATLRALDDPSDEVSLVAALKSEAFACSDVELLEYKLKGGRFSIFANVVDGDPVSESIARLHALYNEKANHSLPAFVDRVVRESFLVESRLLTTALRQRAANLRLIVQRAADFAANEVDSLRPFIRWLSERQREERQREGARETESQVNETDDDVVRVTTIHGAKGLEFPVVILAKLAGGTAPDPDRVVVDREANRLEMQVGSGNNRFSTPGFEEAWNKEKIFEEAEVRRLLYVAATRAKDYLIIPVYKPDRYPGKHVYFSAIPSWSDAVVDREPATFGGAQVLIDSEIRPPQIEATAQPTFPDDLAERWEERSERLQQLAQQGPTYVAPSQLTADEIKEPRETEPKDRSAEESDPDLQGQTQRALGFADGAAGLLLAGSTAALQRGALVHEVLYRCDLTDPENGANWAKRLCQEQGAAAVRSDVERHVRAILASPFMKRVRGATQVLKEVPVAWFDGQTYIEGFADLAFEETDGWVVMDYKSDRVDGDLDAVARPYAPQIQAYKAALSAAGMNVKEAGLWFSSTGDTWISR